MFSFINRTVFDIPLTWDRTRFEATRTKCRQARKLIEISINVIFEKQLNDIHLENLDIEKSITEINEHLLKHEKKVSIFDNLTEIASKSLPNHFDQRMENIRTIIEKHCNDIQKILQEENQYWKEIHSAIDQNLITSNDIHPCVRNNQTMDEQQNTSELINDNSSTCIEIDPPSSNEHIISTKQERCSVVLPPINKTYIIKLDDTTNKSSSIETSPMYSQPNPPAQLYFSPTFLQDEPSEPIRHVLSPFNQNQTNLIKPRVIIQRVSQHVLLNYLKAEENKNFYIQSKLTDSIENETNHHQNSFVIPKPIFKSRTCSAIKNESELIHIAKSRKRKQSVSEDNDIKSDSIALRKRKSVSVIEIEDKKPRKRRNKKTNKDPRPIREPSPLPIIDRSKHYSTRFSTRSHRLNNFTLSTINTDSDDDYKQSKSHSRLQKKTRQTKKSIKSTKTRKR